MGMFQKVLDKIFSNGRSEMKRQIESRPKRNKISTVLSDDTMSEVMSSYHEKIEAKRSEVKHIVDQIDSVGCLSANCNWMFIQEVGQYLSPIGIDSKHTVTLTEVNPRGTNVKILTLECTNSIYSEWIQCCCDTMWHTKNKVLEDIHGNKYPVGKMLNFKCSIQYQ